MRNTPQTENGISYDVMMYHMIGNMALTMFLYTRNSLLTNIERLASVIFVYKARH